MIDFAKVTGIRIPEGDVSALSIDGVQAWKEFFEEIDSWDLEWTYNGDLPSLEEWNYIPTSYTVFVDEAQEAVKITSISLSDATTVKSKIPDGYVYADHAAFEMEFMHADGASYGGRITIMLGADQDQRLKCEIYEDTENGVYELIIYRSIDMAVPNIRKQLTTDEWHTLRLELNVENEYSLSYISLDGAVVDELAAYQIDQTGNQGVYIGATGASIYIRKLMYSGFERIKD